MEIVSIVTPNLNMAEYLERAILSVIKQDYPHIEYIIIDGGSTDGSIEVIKKYEDHIAYWASEKDTGTSNAINNGWRHSAGDFLGLLPSDDLLPPNSVSSAVGFLHQHPDVDFVFGDRGYIDAHDTIIAGEHFREFDLVKYLTHIALRGPEDIFPSVHGALLRRRAFEEVGYLDESIRLANDFDYLLRISLHHKMGYLPVKLGYFRAHSRSPSFTGELGSVVASEIIRIYTKLYSRTDLPQEIVAIRRKAWAGAHHYAAGFYFRAHRSRMALHHLVLAARLDPMRLCRWGFVRLLLPAILGDRGLAAARAAYRRLFRACTGRVFSSPSVEAPEEPASETACTPKASWRGKSTRLERG